MKKKVIIFDMDGVIFDSIPIAEESLLEDHPGMTSEMFREMAGGNFHEEMKKYSKLRKEETEEERAKRHVTYALKKSKAPMFEGIKELLENLHNTGVLLILNTSAYERNSLPLLEKSGIKSLFNLIATAELSKSKIEKFKLIEDKYSVDKGEILFITDSLGDIKEADIAQIPTVAVTWGIHDRKFLEQEKHSNLIGIVDTVKELSDFIKKQ
jgi:HAD superfamily hydrolase (TIGR01509 family)